MEPAISSIAFKGSISEAVVEAKLQKKLFVVYISGDDAESINLEKSTWTNSTVAESLSNYCILLHIQEGSTEASQFSAIYPQKSVPCIAAIGYNGVQLWQKEGFVSAEVLASGLEKAWLSLHIQETTATFLTAALASQKSEQLASGASGTSSSELGSSSRSEIPSLSIDEHRTLAYQEVVEGNKHCEQAEEVNCKLDNDVSSPKVSANELDTGDVEQVPLTETVKKPPNHEMVEFSNTGVGHMPSGVGDGCAVPEVNLNVVDQHSGVNVEASRVIISEASETVLDKKAEIIEIEKADVLDFSRSKSDGVCLNIRLPSGVSIQEKFSIMNTLRMVKDYVDENQEISIGSYDLAIPYPRKLFNDQDLSKTLSELGLLNRQALIVVPHHQAVGHHKGGYSSNKQTNSTNDIGSSNGTNEGYLSFVKRIISYANPFSYLGGSASSSGPVQESQNRMWQYSPNPALQNNLRGTERPQMPNSPIQTTSAPTGVHNRKRFGSNIHTLKHDEDDSRFNDRNAFWNGNSTQYGGDNDGK